MGESVRVIMNGLRDWEIGLFRRSFSYSTSLCCTSKRLPSVVQIGSPADLSSNSYCYSPPTITEIPSISQSLAIAQITRTDSWPPYE